MRAVPGGTQPRFASMYTREWNMAYEVGPTSIGPRVELSTTTWTLVEMAHTIEDVGATSLDAFVLQEGIEGDCFLVDDFEVIRLP